MLVQIIRAALNGGYSTMIRDSSMTSSCRIMRDHEKAFNREWPREEAFVLSSTSSHVCDCLTHHYMGSCFLKECSTGGFSH